LHYYRMKWFWCTYWASFISAFIFCVVSLFGSQSKLDFDDWILNVNNTAPYNNRGDRDIVPGTALPIFVACNLLVLAVFEWLAFSGDYTADRKIVFMNMIFSYLEALLWTWGCTELGKNWVGEPRPDFVSRCLSNGGSFDANGILVCNTDDASVRDGRKSFPSGHSSISMVSGFFLTLYLIWMMYGRTWRKPACFKHPLFSAVHSLVFPMCLFPLLVVFAIAASRVLDHHHSTGDVTGGCFLGFIVAAALFFRLFISTPAYGYGPLNNAKVHVQPALVPMV